MRTWSDVVFLDYIGVEGQLLSEALAAFADEVEEAHEPGDEPCHCYYCQVFIPMALKLERLVAEIKP